MDYFQGYLFAKPLTTAELAQSAYKFREHDALFARIKAELAAEEKETDPA